MQQFRWILFILVIAVAPCEFHGQTVQLDAGKIAGVADTTTGVTSYKGIPYAAPPLGDLRWKAPQAVTHWQGVRRGDHFGPVCMQDDLKAGSFYQVEFYQKPETKSEDCLYLNVWTAAKSASERRPVMFWIHGGGFVEGSGSLPSFDGASLAKKGVVVVTINYRLGVFGFLAHPELTKESIDHSSGNYGLLDQRAALEWVNRNITRFGGDPNNVTIFGQSAGAMSVVALVASPLDKRLIAKAIMQSGGFVPMTPLRQAEEVGASFVTDAGAHSIKDLRARSADQLMENVRSASKLTTGISRFGPIVDGYFLPADVFSIFTRNQENAVQFMAGSTADEGTTLLPPSITVAQYKALLERRFGAKAPEVLKLYPASSDAQAWRSQVDNVRDTMAAGALTLAEVREKEGAKTYLYYFDRSLPGRDSDHYGAFHSSELVYVFDNLSAVDRPWTEVDRKLADAMSTYWTNFAKSGDPNSSGMPQWPVWSTSTKLSLELGTTIRPAAIPDRARLEEFSKNHYSMLF